MQRIEIVQGLTMPFYPMRPATGRKLRTPCLIAEFWATVQEGDWVVQPKLTGRRACLGFVNGTVYIQDRHGAWDRQPVDNRDAFCALPDRTVLDGQVHKQVFYPFEALAQGGRSLLQAPTSERVRAAQALMEAIGQPWKFFVPTPEWLCLRRKNLPEWAGVVLKKTDAAYVPLASDAHYSLTWFKRGWGKSFHIKRRKPAK